MALLTEVPRPEMEDPTPAMSLTMTDFTPAMFVLMPTIPVAALAFVELTLEVTEAC